GAARQRTHGAQAGGAVLFVCGGVGPGQQHDDARAPRRAELAHDAEEPLDATASRDDEQVRWSCTYVYDRVFGAGHVLHLEPMPLEEVADRSPETTRETAQHGGSRPAHRARSAHGSARGGPRLMPQTRAGAAWRRSP